MPVPSALNRRPFVYTTWFILVSLESSMARSECAGAGGAKNIAQQPRLSPVMGSTPNRSLVSLRQSRCGVGPSFCVASGGSVYLLAWISLLLSCNVGFGESIELVLVIAQTPIRFS